MKVILVGLLILTSLFGGCSYFFPPKITKNYYQLDCKILDNYFNLVAQFPGFYCDFSPSGKWLSLEEDTLTLFDKFNNQIYKFPFLVHHELKFSNDDSKIYFLSSEVKTYKNLKTRFDVINISDFKGKILHRWSTYDHIDEIFKTLDLNEYQNAIPTDIPKATRNFTIAPFEFSHLNAIAEIQENSLEKKYPYMKKGNLLVTFNGLKSIVIFDPELKNILHSFTNILKTELYGFHDAQILPNGHLIFFKNVGDKNGELVTSLEEIDIESGEVVWNFAFKKPELEHNPINGSVQVLENDNILIGENSRGGRAIEINRSGDFLTILINPSRDPQTSLPSMVYRAKKINADSFIKNNKLGMWGNKK